LRGRSPFSADREHLHHVFTLAKFSVTATVTMMTAIAIIGVLLSTTFAYLQIAEHYMMAAFALVALLYLWSILRTWKELRFLMRSIDRRVHNVGPSSTVDRRRRSPDGMQSPDAKHPAGKAVGNRTNDGTPSSDLPSTKEA
jgi:UDP-GlcNAc:undecaprenyl-phosphate GlcNAc-1-phosphate transferase